MSSPLGAAATGKRESLKLLRQQNMVYCINAIGRFLKRHPQGNPKRIEFIFTFNAITQSPWSAEEIGIMMLQACHKVYGNPVDLFKDPEQLKQYCIIYHNPSPHTINIRPLGLRDKDNLPLEDVTPGGLISIPHFLAKGGSKSALASIAPQLQPFENQPIREDKLLDLTPASFVEWITFNSYELSECCKRQLLWSDKRQCLLCEKCRKETYL